MADLVSAMEYDHACLTLEKESRLDERGRGGGERLLSNKRDTPF